MGSDERWHNLNKKTGSEWGARATSLFDSLPGRIHFLQEIGIMSRPTPHRVWSLVLVEKVVNGLRELPELKAGSKLRPMFDQLEGCGDPCILRHDGISVFVGLWMTATTLLFSTSTLYTPIFFQLNFREPSSNTSSSVSPYARPTMSIRSQRTGLSTEGARHSSGHVRVKLLTRRY